MNTATYKIHEINFKKMEIEEADQTDFLLGFFYNENFIAYLSKHFLRPVHK